MNHSLTQLALFELAISLLLGVLLLYLTYRIIHKVVGIEDEMGDNNVSFAIFAGSILFSVGSIVGSVIDPLLNTFRLLSGEIESTLTLIGQLFKYLLLFFGISTLIAILVNVIGIGTFIHLTKVKEIQEIRKNNISVAIVTSVIIVVITFFVKDGVVFLLESLVPYPDLPHIN